MDVHLASNFPFLVGLLTSTVTIILYMGLLRFVDFLFAGCLDRRMGIVFALTTFVIGFTQAYYDTTWWFDILQILVCVITFLSITIALEIKFPRLVPYFNSTLWDYRIKSVDNE